MPKKYVKWTDDKIQFIVNKYLTQEMNTYQLANHFGCSSDTISRRLKEQGITPRKFHEDLTGKRIGKLTVLNKSEQSGRRIYWDCICDCGKKITVKGDHLRQQNQLSCGCLTSKGEEKIASILKENNIPFITQYKFKELVSEYNNVPYRFDFAILSEQNDLLYLIEFDGEQHYYYQEGSKWNTLEKFNKRQLLDRKKNKYCLSNNIPLIRIPYYIRDQLTIQDLQIETTRYLVKKE